MHMSIELIFEGETYFSEADVEDGEIIGMLLLDKHGDLVNNPALEKQLAVILLGYVMDDESTQDLESGEYDSVH